MTESVERRTGLGLSGYRWVERKEEPSEGTAGKAPGTTKVGEQKKHNKESERNAGQEQSPSRKTARSQGQEQNKSQEPGGSWRISPKKHHPAGAAISQTHLHLSLGTDLTH